MELQLIFSECNEHTTGSLSLVFAEIVHLNDELVPLVGHVSSSVTVMIPLNWKLKSSKRASADGEEVALTEEWIVRSHGYHVRTSLLIWIGLHLGKFGCMMTCHRILGSRPLSDVTSVGDL